MSKYLGKTVEAAARIFRMWHAKHATTAEPSNYPLDTARVFFVGTAERILYASDKWEDDGDFHDYEHDFDSDPSLFIGDEGEDEEDPTQIMQHSLTGELALPVLGFVREISYVREDGSRRAIKFKTPPVLCSSLDKRAIVVMSESIGPIYVRGGKMRVTERGIVH